MSSTSIGYGCAQVDAAILQCVSVCCRKSQGRREMLNDTELLTEQQTAKMLSLEAVTLRNWRSQRRGPAAVKIGRKSFYRRETIMSWIASREGQYRAEPATTVKAQSKTKRGVRRRK